jgi:hypothetical protein
LRRKRQTALRGSKARRRAALKERPKIPRTNAFFALAGARLRSTFRAYAASPQCARNPPAPQRTLKASRPSFRVEACQHLPELPSRAAAEPDRRR